MLSGKVLLRIQVVTPIISSKQQFDVVKSAANKGSNDISLLLHDKLLLRQQSIHFSSNKLLTFRIGLALSLFRLFITLQCPFLHLMRTHFFHLGRFITIILGMSVSWLGLLINDREYDLCNTYLEDVTFATCYKPARRFFVPLFRAADRTSSTRCHSRDCFFFFTSGSGTESRIKCCTATISFPAL